MRDAFAAQPDDDFDLPAVVRRKAPARPRKGPAKPQRRAGIGEQLLAAALRHPRRIFAALVLTGCGGAIAWNALVMQSARHPAPLFTHGEETVERLDHAPALAQPLPPARPHAELPEAQSPLLAQQPMAEVPAPKPPAVRGAIADLIRSGGAVSPSRTAPAPAVAAVPARERTPPMRDPIGEIIRIGGPVPTPPANVGQPDAGDLVLSGQRALARLGYSVKVDGMMGSETRQAIERFEKDRGLPVTGAFSSRTIRELSAESGITVQ